VTKAKKLDLLMAWAERQSEVFSDIRKQGIKNVIGEHETFESWVHEEFSLLLGLILNEDTSELESLVNLD
jgi:hypothetical protein